MKDRHTICGMPIRVAFAEARRRLGSLLDQVGATHDYVVVTRHGRDAAVLMGVDDYEALVETVAVLGDARALSDLRASEADVAAGQLFEHRYRAIDDFSTRGAGAG